MPGNQTKKDRIILAMERSGKSQRDLAKLLNKSSPTVSEMLSKPGEIDSVSYLEGVAVLTGYSFEWLRTGGGPEQAQLITPTTLTGDNEQYLSGRGVRPLAVTVNQQGRELIVYVSVKAQAGYMKGYGDPHYIEKLPGYALPNVKDGSHRMFQVDGDSMLQLGGGGLHDGDIVIAAYVEDVFSMRDNRVYVIISTEGVIVKRCLNRLRDKENAVLVCNSDNKNGNHPPIILHAHEILEVWELKAFISRQLSFATDLWEVINEMQAQQAVLMDKVKKLETKPLKKNEAH
jgi:phage repressor protein C with HTH and peptisase S24 domain